jgi:hypothetical protein
MLLESIVAKESSLFDRDLLGAVDRLCCRELQHLQDVAAGGDFPFRNPESGTLQRTRASDGTGEFSRHELHRFRSPVRVSLKVKRRAAVGGSNVLVPMAREPERLPPGLIADPKSNPILYCSAIPSISTFPNTNTVRSILDS